MQLNMAAVDRPTQLLLPGGAAAATQNIAPLFPPFPVTFNRFTPAATLTTDTKYQSDVFSGGPGEILDQGYNAQTQTLTIPEGFVLYSCHLYEPEKSSIVYPGSPLKSKVIHFNQTVFYGSSPQVALHGSKANREPSSEFAARARMYELTAQKEITLRGLPRRSRAGGSVGDGSYHVAPFTMDQIPHLLNDTKPMELAMIIPGGVTLQDFGFSLRVYHPWSEPRVWFAMASSLGGQFRDPFTDATKTDSFRAGVRAFFLPGTPMPNAERAARDKDLITTWQYMCAAKCLNNNAGQHGLLRAFKYDWLPVPPKRVWPDLIGILPPLALLELQDKRYPQMPPYTFNDLRAEALKICPLRHRIYSGAVIAAQSAPWLRARYNIILESWPTSVPVDLRALDTAGATWYADNRLELRQYARRGRSIIVSPRHQNDLDGPVDFSDVREVANLKRVPNLTLVRDFIAWQTTHPGQQPLTDLLRVRDPSVRRGGGFWERVIVWPGWGTEQRNALYVFARNMPRLDKHSIDSFVDLEVDEETDTYDEVGHDVGGSESIIPFLKWCQTVPGLDDIAKNALADLTRNSANTFISNHTRHPKQAPSPELLAIRNPLDDRGNKFWQYVIMWPDWGTEERDELYAFALNMPLLTKKSIEEFVNDEVDENGLYDFVNGSKSLGPFLEWWQTV